MKSYAIAKNATDDKELNSLDILKEKYRIVNRDC